MSGFHASQGAAHQEEEMRTEEGLAFPFQQADSTCRRQRAKAENYADPFSFVARCTRSL
jgi:hypothetical protein